MTIKIRAKFVQEGDMLTGLDGGYVFEEPEVNNGYFTYPSSSGRYSVAMPEDIILIGYHDSQGDENYLMIHGNSYITVDGDTEEEFRENLMFDMEEDEEDDDG